MNECTRSFRPWRIRVHEWTPYLADGQRYRHCSRCSLLQYMEEDFGSVR